MSPDGERLTRSLHAELRRWWIDAAKLEGQGTRVPASTLRQRMQMASWHLKAIARAEGIVLNTDDVRD